MSQSPIDMTPPAEDEPSGDEPPREAMGPTLRRLADDADEWRRTDHDEALLYRGRRLRRVEHERWHHWRVDPERFPAPAPLSLRFLEVSRDHAARRSRQRTVAVITVLSVAVVLLTALQLHTRLGIDDERDRRLAAELVATSREMALIDGRLAGRLAAAAWRLEPDDAAWGALAHAYRSPATGSFTGPHGGGINLVAASPDGTVIATGADDGTVGLWNTDDGSNRLLSEPMEGWVEALEFSPDGRLLAAGDSDGQVHVWNLDTGESAVLNGFHSVSLLAFAPDVTAIAAGGEDGLLSIWNFAAGERDAMRWTDLDLTGLEFTPDGAELLATAYGDGVMRSYAADTLEPGAETELVDSTDVSVLERQGYTAQNYLACGDGFGCVMALDPTGPEPRAIGLVDAGSPAAIAPEGDAVAASHISGGLGIWDATNGSLTGVLPYAEFLQDVAFDPDGSTVYAATGNELQRWDIERMHRTETYTGSTFVTGLELADDDRLLVASGPDGTDVWETIEGGPSLRTHEERPGLSLAVAPVGTLAATAVDTSGGTIEIWDVTSGDTALTIEESGAPVTALDFSPDGALLAGATGPDLFRESAPGFGATVWDTATGETVLELDLDPETGVRSVDFSPDGALIATVDYEGRLQLWSSDDGALVDSLDPALDVELMMAGFLPDGALLLHTASDVLSWTPGASEPATAAFGAGYTLSSMDVSPDGGRLTLFESFPTMEIEFQVPRSRVSVWDVDRGVSAAALPIAGTFVQTAFHSDGRTLFVAHDDVVTKFDLGYLEEDVYELVCELDDDPPSRETWEVLIPEAPYGSIDMCPGDF